MTATTPAPKGTQPERAEAGAALLEVRDLSVTFATDRGTARVVHQLSYSVGHAETLAIVGESGSGKTVSSRAVMGLLPPGRQGHRLNQAERPGTGRAAGARDAAAPRPGRGHGVPGPRAVAQPDHEDRPAGHRGDQAAVADRAAAGQAAGGRPAWPGPAAVARAPFPRVPAPAVRGHAPAGDDRDSARWQPEAAHRRRGHHGPGRHHAGPDHGPPARPADGVPDGPHPDQPRHGPGGQLRADRDGDVRRAGRRACPGGGAVHRRAHAVHEGAARRGAPA